MSENESDRAARFRRLYAGSYRSLAGYARRRTLSAEDAADVVAETFLVAWERREAMPSGDKALPWLFGVARNVIANQQRGTQRQQRIARRLHFELAPVAVESPEDAATSVAGEALGRLSEPDRELLRLVAWEGLGPSEIATVLNCSGGAVRVRLLRARRRFAHHFGTLSGEPVAEAAIVEVPRVPSCQPGGELAHG